MIVARGKRIGYGHQYGTQPMDATMAGNWAPKPKPMIATKWAPSIRTKPPRTRSTKRPILDMRPRMPRNAGWTAGTGKSWRNYTANPRQRQRRLTAQSRPLALNLRRIAPMDQVRSHSRNALRGYATYSAAVAISTAHAAAGRRSRLTARRRDACRQLLLAERHCADPGIPVWSPTDQGKQPLAEAHWNIEWPERSVTPRPSLPSRPSEQDRAWHPAAWQLTTAPPKNARTCPVPSR